MGQRCALLWLLMRGHRGLFGYPTLLSQWVIYIQYGRYKNSRTVAAFFVPHQHFSGAKININSETSKLFVGNFSNRQKQRNAGFKILRSLCIELLQ